MLRDSQADERKALVTATIFSSFPFLDSERYYTAVNCHRFRIAVFKIWNLGNLRQGDLAGAFAAMWTAD
jgi:hypothetical protein